MGKQALLCLVEPEPEAVGGAPRPGAALPGLVGRGAKKNVQAAAGGGRRVVAQMAAA